MTHSFDDVSGTCFTFGADHRRTLTNATKRFSEVASPTNERNFELVLVDVMLFIGRRQHFAFIDEVDPQRFEYLRFGEVTYADFGHHRNRDNGHDLPNPLG